MSIKSVRIPKVGERVMRVEEPLVERIVEPRVDAEDLADLVDEWDAEDVLVFFTLFRKFPDTDRSSAERHREIFLTIDGLEHYHQTSRTSTCNTGNSFQIVIEGYEFSHAIAQPRCHVNGIARSNRILLQ